MGLALSSAAGFSAAVAHAHQVAFASYTLHPGVVLGALEAAARRGAAVRVRLEGDPLEAPHGRLERENAAAVAELRAAGADAALSDGRDPGLHTKAAVVDGTAWLDDRNWLGTAGEVIVRDDDPADVAAVASALEGRPANTAQLATTKADALARELQVIEGAGAAPLAVESESFGSGTIYAALLRRAAAHEPTRLLVAGREAGEPANGAERTCLARLAALGVEVRTGDPHHDANEKFALGGDAAWAGSANATYAGGPFGAQSDWGVTTRDPALIDGLRAAFERNWSAARPVAGARSAS